MLCGLIDYFVPVVLQVLAFPKTKKSGNSLSRHQIAPCLSDGMYDMGEVSSHFVSSRVHVRNLHPGANLHLPM